MVRNSTRLLHDLLPRIGQWSSNVSTQVSEHDVLHETGLLVTPSKETPYLVSENGSNSRVVPIPINVQPFANVASNSGKFPTAAAVQTEIDSTHHRIKLVWR